jgi:small subunit ribosomal protein S19e
MENVIYELSGEKFNKLLANLLKEIPEINAPEWIVYVKSSSGKERPIEDPDFWYKRTASILRSAYLKGIIGVNRLRTKYGSKKNRGSKPESFRKAGGKIIRTILQQCDAAGLTEIDKGVRGVRSRKPGRKLTEKGKTFLENVKDQQKEKSPSKEDSKEK